MVDVLDRVLDKGVVVIANVGVSVVGLRLIDLNARIVVSSIDTYVSRAETIEAVANARPVRIAPSGGALRKPLSAPRPRRRLRGGRRRPAPTPVTDVIRCANGCSFERATVSVASDGTLACPYRRGVWCRLDEAAA